MGWEVNTGAPVDIVDSMVYNAADAASTLKAEEEKYFVCNIQLSSAQDSL